MQYSGLPREKRDLEQNSLARTTVRSPLLKLRFLEMDSPGLCATLGWLRFFCIWPVAFVPSPTSIWAF
jgi:hypothetical protein